MTQPIDIITSSLSAIGALAPGEPLEASLAQDAFNMLNRLLDRVSNDDFMITSIQETISTIGGQTTYTIGPTGQIVCARPLVINSAFARVAGIDYQVRPLNIEQYELIGFKSLGGPWPKALYYNSGTPNGTITFWPLPSTCEIHLFSSLLFTRFVTINDTLQFTQGYEMWMVWALAKLLMPGYGKTDPNLYQMVAANEKEAMASIKGSNMQPAQVASFDSALMTNRLKDAGWIMSGGF